MKIIIQSINFHPELTGIGKYTSEMAHWLASNGHTVRVITGYPYYPHWKIDFTYRKYFWTSESWQSVKVMRCPIWVPEIPNGIKRICHLASFALSSFPIMLAQIFWRPNIILTIEPPLFAAPAALLTSFFSGAKSILHIQDFEVDAAFDLGLLKGDELKKFVIKVEKFLLKRFDLVSTISNRMLVGAKSKGVNAEKAFLFPNWVSVPPRCKWNRNDYDVVMEERLAYLWQLGVPSDGVIALYSGNMGAKQGLEVMGEAARLLTEAQNLSTPIYFIFCGDGVGRKNLEIQCRDLRSVYFLDLQPPELLPKFLAMADIHLLPQKADAVDLVMPSKLTGILASGGPFIAMSDENSELANIAHHCGIIVPPGDLKAFYDALIELSTDVNLRRKLGLSGHRYALENLGTDRIMSGFEIKLKEISGY